MLQLVSSVWALLLGIFLIMVGNGMQSTLMGVRGDLEGFTTFELSLVTSGYLMSFLAGSWMTPEMIRKVSHVRVFAALGLLMSAGLIAIPLLTDPWSWTVLRHIQLNNVLTKPQTDQINDPCGETPNCLVGAIPDKPADQQ